MNKKALVITVGIVAVLIAIVGSIVILLNSKNSEAVEQDNNANTSVVENPTVEDNRDVMTEENMANAFKNNEKLSSDFVINFYESGGFTKLSSGFKSVNDTIISGYNRNNSLELVEGAFTTGSNGKTPEFGLSIMAVETSEDEIEKLCYGIIKDAVGEKFANIMDEMEYNDNQTFDISDSEIYQDVRFNKTRVERSITDPNSSDENATVNTVEYSFGITYSTYLDAVNLTDSYTNSENDSKIYMNIPIIAESGDDNLSTGYPVIRLADAQGVIGADILAYNYSTSESTESCQLDVKTGGYYDDEQLTSIFYCNLDKATGNFTYSYESMTKYYDTKDKALEAAVNLINKIDGVSYTVEDCTESDTNTYIIIGDETDNEYNSRVITIDGEFGIGYYAEVTTI